ncbi:MAG: phosphohistidine phosphatase SixA [Pseudomonadota bacterium]
MELILWRHAEAEDGLNDLARELTPKGRKQAAKMAAWLNTRLPNGCRVLVSPAARAQQTAQALQRRIETLSALAPGAAVKDLLKAAGWPGSDQDCVLIAGHQPDLGRVAAHLLGGQGPFSIRKGAIWWFSGRARADGNEVLLRAVIAPDLL